MEKEELERIQATLLYEAAKRTSPEYKNTIEKYARNRPMYYDMEGKACKNFLDDREVKQETVGDFYVSTVLLGIDHNFCGEGEPIIFETMIFYRPPTDAESFSDIYCDRYCTREEALEGHEVAKKWVLSGEADKKIKSSGE